MKTRKGWKDLRLIRFLMPFLIGISLGSATSVYADDYPNRYIDLIIPYGPGGGTDLGPRIWKECLEKALGKPLIWNYKPGAGAIVGVTYFKTLRPDGYSLMSISTPSYITPVAAGRTKNWGMDDFTPVGTVCMYPQVICVKKESPYRTLQDLIEAAKKKTMTFATSGVLSVAHLVTEALFEEAGVPAFTHIPSKTGAADAATSVMGGHVDIFVGATTGIENQLRILAVSTEKRFETLPDVPSLKEFGYSAVSPSYISLWAPRGTSEERVSKIHQSIKRCFQENREVFQQRAAAINNSAIVLSPGELLEIVSKDFKWFKSMCDKLAAGVKK